MKYLFLVIFSLSSILLFSNEKLKVAVYDKAPFGTQEQNGKFSGLMVDLWEDIAKDLNIESEYELVDMKTLLSGINNGQYHVGLGAISVTPEREKLVDFSYAVNPSGTTIGIAKHKKEVAFFDKWGPVLWELLRLLGILFLMLLVAATLVWLVEKKHVKKSLDSDKSIRNIADGLWWSAVTMTTVGYGDKVPMSKFGKVIGVVWIFFSIIFFSLFTANASAKLTEANVPKSSIQNLSDLHQHKVVSVENSSGAAFLIREKVDFKSVKSLQEATDLVLHGEYDAVVYNAPVLKYFNRTKLKSKLDVSNNYLLKNNMAIALQPNSKFREQINLILLEKISEAKWQSAVYKYIGD